MNIKNYLSGLALAAFLSYSSIAGAKQECTSIPTTICVGFLCTTSYTMNCIEVFDPKEEDIIEMCNRWEKYNPMTRECEDGRLRRLR